MNTALAPIVGVSAAIHRAKQLIERFAPTELSIMLVGATGTGKELFASHIHAASQRRGELIDINCGALPQDLAESLLFGHRKGAFTGAVDSLVGHLERAHNGTLFLDEVLHLSASGQVKVLRALDTGEVQPVGSTCKRCVDLRVVSAAQEDMPDQLRSGSFRHDLFQRLAGIVIELPLLIDRPEDIGPLAEHFASARGKHVEPDAHEALHEHSWPGNVRELRLAIRRAGYLVENRRLPAGAVRDAIALGIAPKKCRTDRRKIERQGTERRKRMTVRRSWDDLLGKCEANGWDAARIAEALQVPRSTLYDRLKVAGISLRKFRKSGYSGFRTSVGIPKNGRLVFEQPSEATSVMK